MQRASTWERLGPRNSDSQVSGFGYRISGSGLATWGWSCLGFRISFLCFVFLGEGLGVSVLAPREVGVGEVGSKEERFARLEDAVVQEVDVEQPCRGVQGFDSGATGSVFDFIFNFNFQFRFSFLFIFLFWVWGSLLE